MAASPGQAVIGVSILAFGVVIVYGGYRNLKVFGKDGILAQAISTGQFVNVSKIPKMTEAASTTTTPTPTVQNAAHTAIQEIKDQNSTLGTNIENEVTKIENGSKSTGLLSGYLTMARTLGLQSQADIIWTYARTLATPVSGPGGGLLR